MPTDPLIDYLEQEHRVPRARATNQVAADGKEYGIDGFHFDEARRNLYLFVLKDSTSYSAFKVPIMQLIDGGIERIFSEPQKGDRRNQFALQLHSSLAENRRVIEQVCFRFIFNGDPEEAERSQIIGKYREEIESKKYLLDEFFGRDVGLIVEFRSATGKVGALQKVQHNAEFEIALEDAVKVDTSSGERMYLGFMRLADLHRIHRDIGPRFFDRNIRYGLGENEAVNRAISKALRQVIVDRVDDPSTFAFNHNGITIFAERFEPAGDKWRLTAPRLLNGAQTVTTLHNFLEASRDTAGFSPDRFRAVRVICKVITKADQKFVTRVTINNNRQNPVEPWNLHANDDIQLELQDKFRQDVGIYYERQENAFDQLGAEDLEEYGIQESRALQMLKITQTFLLTDGAISRMSEMRRVFEDEKAYDQVFRRTRLKADSRDIVICYKVQFRLRKLASEIIEIGQNKYWFIGRARSLLWALLCQGLLNHEHLEDIREKHGRSLAISNEYVELLAGLATTRARILLKELIEDRDYAEKVAQENLGFLRTDRAFDKCMEMAGKNWGWVHKKLA